MFWICVFRNRKMPRNVMPGANLQLPGIIVCCTGTQMYCHAAEFCMFLIDQSSTYLLLAKNSRDSPQNFVALVCFWQPSFTNAPGRSARIFILLLPIHKFISFLQPDDIRELNFIASVHLALGWKRKMDCKFCSCWRIQILQFQSWGVTQTDFLIPALRGARFCLASPCCVGINIFIFAAPLQWNYTFLLHFWESVSHAAWRLFFLGVPMLHGNQYFHFCNTSAVILHVFASCFEIGFPCCVALVFFWRPHAAWESIFSFLQHLCSETACFFEFVR